MEEGRSSWVVAEWELEQHWNLWDMKGGGGTFAF